MMAWQGCTLSDICLPLKTFPSLSCSDFLSSLVSRHALNLLSFKDHLLFSSFTIYSSFIYVRGCFSTYMHMHCLYTSCLWRQKRLSSLLQPELQMVESQHTYAGKQPQVFCMESKWCESPSHLSLTI